MFSAGDDDEHARPPVARRGADRVAELGPADGLVRDDEDPPLVARVRRAARSTGGCSLRLPAEEPDETSTERTTNTASPTQRPPSAAAIAIATK